MLVLTRRPSQAICLGEQGEVKITVLGFNGNQIKLGIEADRNIAIYREEIFEIKKAQKVQLDEVA